MVWGERERAPPGKVGGRWKVRVVCVGGVVAEVKGRVRRVRRR